MTRAGMILIQDHKIALIERTRKETHYFHMPGGRVEEGETIEEAVVREAEEELGLRVHVEQLIAIIHYRKAPQYYYWFKPISGIFGQGRGPEMIGLYPPERGSYQAIWMPLDELIHHEIRPAPLISLLYDIDLGKFPAQPYEFFEDN